MLTIIVLVYVNEAKHCMVAAVGWRNLLTIPLTPPQPFDLKKPDEWQKWKRCFEQFLSASGLDKDDDRSTPSKHPNVLFGNDTEGVLATSKTMIAKSMRKW